MKTPSSQANSSANNKNTENSKKIKHIKQGRTAVRLTTLFLDDVSCDSDNWFYNYNAEPKIEIEEATKSINNEKMDSCRTSRVVQLPSIKTLMSDDSFNYNETFKTSTIGNEQSMQSSVFFSAKSQHFFPEPMVANKQNIMTLTKRTLPT